MKVIVTLVSSLLALLSLSWLGLRIKPKPFPAFPQPAPQMETVPLPEGLPVPVERFYRQIYGENVPVIESAVLTGRGVMRISGLTFPARFRITHEAGHSYHHYFETTLFGLPVMKVNEYYLDGKGRMELPFGVIEGEPKVDQAANLALWAESLVWLPALLITNARVHWEALDEATALLVVPFGEAEEHFVVRFDPASGLPYLVESMRFKEATSQTKTLWLNEAQNWEPLNGYPVSTTASLTWLDDGRPWVKFKVEEVVYNVDVDVSLAAKGP